MHRSVPHFPKHPVAAQGRQADPVNPADRSTLNSRIKSRSIGLGVRRASSFGGLIQVKAPPRRTAYFMIVEPVVRA
jgi:hypothetical protein